MFVTEPHSFMQEAIRLGEKGRMGAPPNPWVGCVIVKNGKIIGSGYHHRCGEDHAEVMAIKSATESVEGADLYVTLEPCCHYGRTPPCTDFIIRHRIARVFIALFDPDLRVCGDGVRALLQANIEVRTGIEESLARQSLQPYLYHREHKHPWVVLKAAASLDGQLADRTGKSQWITCPKAREHVGILRAQSQAILVGADTVIKDNPSLTARDGKGQLLPFQPMRVVLDSQGRVPLESKVFHGPGRTLYATTQCSPERREQLQVLGVDCLVTTQTASRVDLLELLHYLYARGCLQVLIEGGRQVYTSFLAQDLVQSFVFYFGPKLLSDQNMSVFGPLPILLPTSLPIQIRSATVIGQSVCVIAERALQ